VAKGIRLPLSAPLPKKDHWSILPNAYFNLLFMYAPIGVIELIAAKAKINTLT
jgi:hypothetical protein